jgi:hypothetical protein
MAGADQYATWIREPGEEPAELDLRREQIAAQGLRMAGKPHPCRTITDGGAELWAVALEPSDDG